MIPQPPGRIEQGHIVFEGTDLLTLSDKDMRRIRGNRIAMIFQEPTTALDVTIQVQILKLIHRLRVDTETAIFLITHDLGVIAEMADTVAVMYLGKIVELGNCRELFLQPLHPYTEALIAAVPITDRKKRGRRIILDSNVPSPLNPPRGCRFHPRCRYRQNRCTGQEPQLKEVNTDRGPPATTRCMICLAGEILI